MTIRALLALCVLSAMFATKATAEDGYGYTYEGNASAVQDYTFNSNAPAAPMMPEYSTWHAGYYHTMWGRPVAMVVPPTATHHTNWGWGIGNTRVTPIYPQYLGPMNSAVTQMGYGPYRAQPYYTSDTLQFGVYYIRGPW